MQHASTMKVITIFCALFPLIFIVSAGRWSDWQPFGPCESVQERRNNGLGAVDLQEGNQTRSRFCLEEDIELATDEYEMLLGDCVVNEKETESRACRIPTAWTEFLEEVGCSVTCGSGIKRMKRDCILNTDALPGEDNQEICSLGKEERVSHPCKKRACPENGGWSEWSDWGACGSADCHFPAQTRIQGLSYKVRTCSEPIPKYGGKMCDGPFMKTGVCFDPVNCPTDGGWSDWTPYGNWNCKKLSRNRTRVCNKPPSRNGGRKCEGSAINFFDSLSNEESFNKTCGTVPKMVNQDENPTPVPTAENSDYDLNNMY